MSTFSHFALHPHIQTAIRAAGYTEPTPIQQQAIPLVLEGRDVLGLAQTGTGKTAAFVLPLLQRLGASPRKRLRVLILEPTRELAEQVHQAIASLGANTGIRSATAYGGVSKAPQIRNLRSGCEIVVGCPGRLLDLIHEGSMNLQSIETLVLDEADRLCDMGFLPDVRRLLSHLPVNRQTLFFSATMPADIRGLADSILKNPACVQAGPLAPVETVTHALYPVSETMKSELLLSLLRKTPTGRVLVFTRTKHRAVKVAERLNKRGFRVSALQGNMAQNRRLAAIDGFRSGKYDILVATDIAARGIDISEISHVINFDMPDTADAYTHRIGRTGRARRAGEAFTFTLAADEPLVRQIEKTLGSRIERRSIPEFAAKFPVVGPSRETAKVETRRGTVSSRLTKTQQPTGLHSRPAGSRRGRAGIAHQS